MVQYKLYYFGGRGLGEVIRQLFALAAVDFEDIRVTQEQWPALKPKMPFGNLPVLEVDGQQIPQSQAIARYVARKYGYAGKTPYEEAIVDALADQYKDFYVEIKNFYYPAMGLAKGDVESAKKNILIPARDRFLGYMTNFLKKSNTGYLVGNDLTYADLILAEHVFSIRTVFPEYTNGFPEVEEHYRKVTSVPKLKKWLDERPKTRMPFGQMPVLEVDGEQIPQSLAITRYLARKYGFAGKTPYEEAIVDALADQYKDFYVEIKSYYYPAMGLAEGDVVCAIALPFFSSVLNV
uniref:glutathione transferase n=1 Tax=Angiostrongylus cantonensis TaxID=6313 RepID=A0A158P8Y6_ANGCA